MAYYCIPCGKEILRHQTDEFCECGRFKYALGSNFKITDGKLICDCGNDKFKRKNALHSDIIYFQGYECTECGNDNINVKVHINDKH